METEGLRWYREVNGIGMSASSGVTSLLGQEEARAAAIDFPFPQK
jgi:hypothetical protein